MKRFNIENFDKEKRKDEIITFIELVTNDKEERGIESFECENMEDAKENLEELNKRNNDKRFKYIITEYLGSEIG